MPSPGLARIAVQLRWLHQFQFAGYYAAVEKGFYREAGLDVALVEGSPGRDPVSEVLAGRVQYGVENSGLLYRWLKGDPLVALAAVFQHSPSVLLARGDSRIYTPQDLIGRRVMMMGGVNDAELLAMLHSEGVTLDAIERVDSSYDVQDLISRKTDAFNAYLTNEPYVLKHLGIASSVISPVSYGIDFYGDVLFTSRKEAASQPRRLKSFLDATLRGWGYAMDHPEEIIDLIIDKYGSRKSRAHLRYEARVMRKLIQPEFVALGHMNPGRWRHIADAFVRLEMVEPYESLDGFMYEPYPVPDYTWFWWFLAVVIAVVILLLVFYNRLRVAVRERTMELQWTNESLLAEVAERRRAEKALRESETRFRAVADHTPAALYFKDRDGRILLANRRYREWYAGGAKVQGKTAGDLFAPALSKQFVDQDRSVLASANPIEFESTLQRTDGVERTYLIAKFPVRDADGTVVGVGGINTDITGRKLAEEAVRESEERLNLALEAAAIGTWRWSIDSGRMSWDEHLHRLFGLEPGESPHDLAGLLKLVHAEDRERVARDFQETVAGGTDFSTEFRILWPDSSLRFLNVRGKVYWEEAGSPVHMSGVCWDNTEAHVLSKQLAYRASHDSLTGLVNRQAFEQSLRRVLDTARFENEEHALCYVDLDQFKVINDTCGHIAGDELLRQLGILLPGCLRKRDTIARLGGDEFGVLMEDCSLDQATRVAEVLRNTISEFRFLWEDKSFTLGASIGLVPIAGARQRTSDVLSQADSACYAAKDAGRNRIHVFQEDDAELSRRHGEMRWVSRINLALEEDRLQLCYQTIAPIRPGGEMGRHYELLVRMVDEEGKIVPPGAFLPAAERYNLATRLDRWVIGAAFRWLRNHPQHLNELFLCSINLSGQSLSDQELSQFINQQFDETGVSPMKICFEITETAAIANLAAATNFIGELKERGCSFALDDFGSGLSSFAYLKNLPVDFLKIDGVFVKDIADDPIDLAIVRSINELGRVMGKRTIAEFVENDAILRELRNIGVDFAQGYGIGRPAPICELDTCVPEARRATS